MGRMVAWSMRQWVSYGMPRRVSRYDIVTVTGWSSVCVREMSTCVQMGFASRIACLDFSGLHNHTAESLQPTYAPPFLTNNNQLRSRRVRASLSQSKGWIDPSGKGTVTEALEFLTGLSRFTGRGVFSTVFILFYRFLQNLGLCSSQIGR